MAVLKKELTLYDRDADGNLIPRQVPLILSDLDRTQYPELDGMEVSVIPLCRGDIKGLFGLEGKDTDKAPDTSRDDDIELILKYCKTPEYTREETKFLKPVIVRSIVRTILSESGIKTDEETGQRRLDKDADEFGKNSSGLNEKKKKGV